MCVFTHGSLFKLLSVLTLLLDSVDEVAVLRTLPQIALSPELGGSVVGLPELGPE